MSAFLTDLVTLDDGNGTTERLVVDLIYQSDLLDREIRVPAGFVTDYASVPIGLWNILPTVGKTDRAAIVHDFLYAVNGVSRGVADAVFAEALDVCGVAAWRRRIMYLGVRVGGWKAWHRYRTEAV